MCIRDRLESAVAPVPPASEQRYRVIDDERFEPHWRTPIRRAAEPVSYTHLDVYKRQGEFPAASTNARR